MTRFLMSLADSVELVEHAFQHARPGDIFIRKAAACTVGDLAEAVCDLFDVPAKLDVIGVRHGEKQDETLASREELAQAEDFGDFFRVPLDARDLNYALYVSEGELGQGPPEDFNSANAPRLGVPRDRRAAEDAAGGPRGAGPAGPGAGVLRLAVTGAGGFLGWHVRVLLRVLGWPEPVVVTRADLADPQRVAAKLDGVDRVLHLAGVNRGEPADVAAGNVQLAAQLAQGLKHCPTPPGAVVFANSVQAGNGTPYGDAKAAAAGILADTGLPFDDVLLPNLYGEHGRPYYNSAVATFCRLLAEGGQPEVHGDRELSLVHVTDAAARLVGVPAGGSWDPAMPALRTGVRALADRLADVAATYRTGELPALVDRHDVRLFNTYRSHCFPAHYPLALPRRADARGELVETVRTHGGGGQTFCSTTRPGITRGEHFHLAKVERFVVLRGYGGDQPAPGRRHRGGAVPGLRRRAGAGGHAHHVGAQAGQHRSGRPGHHVLDQRAVRPGPAGHLARAGGDGPTGARGGRRVRIGLVSQWYPPEGVFIPGNLARQLAERGPRGAGAHHLSELSVRPGLPRLAAALATHRDRRAGRRPAGARLSQPRHVRRPARAEPPVLRGQQRAGRRAGWRTPTSPTSTTRHPPSIAAAALHRLARRTPIVLHVQDLWPESVLGVGHGARRPGRPGPGAQRRRTDARDVPPGAVPSW